MDLYLLYESPSGYALFVRKEFDEIGQADMSQAVQESVMDVKQFCKQVKLVAFIPFHTAEEALAEIQSVVSSQCSEFLSNFLETNLPKQKKKKSSEASPKYQLAVLDTKLAESIGTLGYSVTASPVSKELLRGCRQHFSKLMNKSVTESDLDRARCGLAHAFSRTKMKFDPNRQDKPILSASTILDGLDKDINTFAMRVREWYSWHFPELAKIAQDNIVYAKLTQTIRIKEEFDFEKRRNELIEICGGSEELVDSIEKAAKHSMGTEIVEFDMVNMEHFAKEVVKLSEMRNSLQDYLKGKMTLIAPNLTALIGETVGARLISHAGSLTNLAKYPASTIQILGAEKALFRALKNKGNTPKYGLIFHSGFIGKAQQKNKGRISRYLANKCSLASRIDCFGDANVSVFGEKMHEQVEDRLTYLVTGQKPKKNADVMKEAVAQVAAIAEEEKKKTKKSKRKSVAQDERQAPAVVEEIVVADEEKKKKKRRKEVSVE